MAYLLQTGDIVCICLDCNSRSVSTSRHASAKVTQQGDANLKDPGQAQLADTLVEMGFNYFAAAKAAAAGLHTTLTYLCSRHTRIVLTIQPVSYSR
jgi:hypothetical protein